MERAFYINKFRNIGLDKSERLVLNHSLEKGKIGDLVILVGPNNSGKSNVLDALYIFGQKNISQRDKTDLALEPEMQKPSLSLVCKDGKDEYSYTLDSNNKVSISYPDVQKQEPKFDYLGNIKEFNESLSILYQFIRNFGVNIQELRILINKMSEQDYVKNNILNVMTVVKDYINTNGNVKSAWTEYKINYPNSILVKSFKEYINSDNKEKLLEETYFNKYGVNFLPKIILYKEQVIKNNDIACNINDLKNNKFICKLLKLIGVSVDEVLNAYKSFQEQTTRNALTNLQRKVNKKLNSLTKQFNDLYFAEEDKYEFKLTFETSNIYFELNRGNSAINLNYQSTGFKWFFNLYFNLLSDETLNPGDIIIMDEPATNLHMQGLIELRAFLKEFAVQNDITLVLATHLPQLIDVNNLDELRVIVNSDNKSIINNDFTAIDIDDPDTLKPVKQALTVGNHMLYDPDRKVIFVEGITDYNYLLAFKKILDVKEDLIFMPIQGVENIKEAGYKERQKERSKRLIEIRKHNPILLVDGDNAGKSMKQINKEDSDLTVFSLIDIDPKFIMIEHLFSDEDKNKLGLIKEGNNKFEKSSSKSALLKAHYDQYDFTDETKNNFKKVFEYIAKNTD